MCTESSDVVGVVYLYEIDPRAALIYAWLHQVDILRQVSVGCCSSQNNAGFFSG